MKVRLCSEETPGVQNSTKKGGFETTQRIGKKYFIFATGYRTEGLIKPPLSHLNSGGQPITVAPNVGK